MYYAELVGVLLFCSFSEICTRLVITVDDDDGTRRIFILRKSHR